MADIVSLAKGRYRIVQKLGQGGMAVVDLALDTKRGIPVAIKRPLPNLLLAPKALERFGQELETHSRVIHPNVVTVIDFGVEKFADGSRTPYIVIEYAGGVTVDGCFASSKFGGFGPLPPSIAGRILLPVIGALRCMHQDGVLHRDIKPANIMVGWNPVGFHSTAWDPNAVKLMDFGIARSTEATERKTGTKVVMGTDGYIAPEQFRNTKEVDHRADLYSVGVTLWAMLTGSDPQEDLHNLEIGDAAFEALPEPWRTIAFGATRYQKEKRSYQSAEELGSAIEAALRDNVDRRGPFEHWLTQKKVDSPVEAALRRARGKGLTIVAEVDEPSPASGAGNTRWFQEVDGSDGESPAVGAAESVAPLPKSRTRYLAAAAGFAVMAAFVAFSVTDRNGTTGSAPETAEPSAIVASALPTPSVGSGAAGNSVVSTGNPDASHLPTPSVGSEVPTTTVVAKPKGTGRSGAITTPIPSSNGGGETPMTVVSTVQPVVVPITAPEPEKGSVHLVSGATSISLVGSDGASHAPGRVSPGTYSIRATFVTKGQVANAGTVTVLAGQDLSVTCLEAMALCKAR